jgi:hypothetical protein
MLRGAVISQSSLAALEKPIKNKINPHGGLLGVQKLRKPLSFGCIFSPLSAPLAPRTFYFPLGGLLAQPSTCTQSKGQPGGQPSRNSTTRFVCTCFAPPTAALANSLRSEIRPGPPFGTTYLAHPSTRAQSKGQPGGDPSRNSTSRFACTCFTPPFPLCILTTAIRITN